MFHIMICGQKLKAKTEINVCLALIHFRCMIMVVFCKIPSILCVYITSKSVACMAVTCGLSPVYW